MNIDMDLWEDTPSKNIKLNTDYQQITCNDERCFKDKAVYFSVTKNSSIVV